jgi:hypothetical protein
VCELIRAFMPQLSYSVSEFRFKLWNWKSTRRFVVVREEVQSNKAAVGRKLIDLPGYVFRVFVYESQLFSFGSPLTPGSRCRVWPRSLTLYPSRTFLKDPRSPSSRNWL